MKRRLLTVLMCLACAVQVWAEDSTQKLDSIITYNSNGSYEAKTVFTYDGNKVSSKENYSYQGGKWIESSKVLYDYDSNDNLILEEKYYYSSSDESTYYGEWMKGSKETFEYDKNGKVVLEVRYDVEDNEWINYHKNIYEYDVNNNKSLEERYIYQNDEWAKSNKYIWTYNAKNIMTTKEEYTAEYYEWKKWRKYVYVYEKGNIIEEIVYSAQNDAWINYHKTEYSYNENDSLSTKTYYDWWNYWKYSYEERYSYDNNLTLCESVNSGGKIRESISSYDQNNNLILQEEYLVNEEGVIIKDHKYVYEYDGNNNKILDEYYMGNEKENGWEKREKRVYAFDDNNNKTLEEYYDGYDIEWTRRSMYEWIYDERGLLIRENYQGFSFETYSIYHYSDISTSIETPEADSQVYISNNTLYVNTPTAETISVYSVQGQLLNTFTKGVGETSFPLAGNTNEVVIVRTESGITKKLVN